MHHHKHHSSTLWKYRLHQRLWEQAYPLWIDDEGILPAASLWHCIRTNVQILRAYSISSGDRILIALPQQRSYIAWLLAGLWEGCSVALAAPSSDTDMLSELLDVRLVIHSDGLTTRPQTRFPPTPDICLFLASSGSTGQPRWIALSVHNIFSVLDSHIPALQLADMARLDTQYPAARVLSLLPLHHAFGLIIDFFTAFFCGAEIIRDSYSGRDVAHILYLARYYNITHCSMVPLLAKRLQAIPEGQAFLKCLQGGVIGGAPVDAELARVLSNTQLRAGYGQTEASPGITLGDPGIWYAGYIGSAQGCTTRLSFRGTLEFFGANLALGEWTNAGLVRYDACAWRDTGDYAQESPYLNAPGYIFIGRTDDTFKLANGRHVPAPHWEQILKTNIPYCCDAIITTHDGVTCSVGLLVEASPNDINHCALRAIICEVLAISPSILGTVRCFTSEQWHYTAKGQSDRQALHQILGTPAPQITECGNMYNV
ncbi:MAG: class I adenylate-forming enzyme family protein [Bacteroidota bacterium]|nr:acyl--CoA ligase [Candidatus Kapabacteria bacterium]MDW8221248.1 class I adenylate-forming enzyme family protein [Bacteroidota bacterium]